MKKILTLTAGLLFIASAAMAQSGLNLNASNTATTADCYAGGTVLKSVSNACTSNTGTAFNLLASVVPSGDDPDFIGAATIIDLQSSAATLPSWWDGSGTGCRPGAISALQDGTIDTTCPSPWDNRADVLPVFAVQPGTGGPNRVRFNGGAAITSSIDIPGDGTIEYGVLKLAVSKAKSVGTGSCAGCATGACIVLNEINFQPANTAAAWTRYTNPTTPGSNAVTYQSGAPVCAGATPTTNKSWGSIKALYR
jgi:hypothetical protein